ncbi:MAG: hypothetical protein ACXVZ1_08135 [Gaiellaceae bacterium]
MFRKGRGGRQREAVAVWSSRSSGRRVLVENPDGADLAAHAFVLREAGYDVATCRGAIPVEGKELSCPLIAGKACSLVEGADVVVTSCDLAGCRAILEAHSLLGSPPIVLEAPAPSLDRWNDVAGDALLLPFPVTSDSLREAVATLVSA